MSVRLTPEYEKAVLEKIDLPLDAGYPIAVEDVQPLYALAEKLIAANDEWKDESKGQYEIIRMYRITEESLVRERAAALALAEQRAGEIAMLRKALTPFAVDDHAIERGPYGETWEACRYCECPTYVSVVTHERDCPVTVARAALAAVPTPDTIAQ
jgi:hypothetical protein